MGFFSSILGLGRGKKNAKYSLTGFNYAKDNPALQASQGAGTAATSTLAAALGLGGGGGGGGYGGFNAEAYFAANPDVAQGYQRDFAADPNLLQSLEAEGYAPSAAGFAQRHYDRHGVAEGRSLGDTGSAGGGGGAGGGFGGFLDSIGYKFARDEAMRGVVNSAAGTGLLRSGAAVKAAQDRAANLAQQGAMSYYGLLGQLAGQGQNAALGVASQGTSGGGAAAASQPQNTGLLGLPSRLGLSAKFNI